MKKYSFLLLLFLAITGYTKAQTICIDPFDYASNEQGAESDMIAIDWNYDGSMDYLVVETDSNKVYIQYGIGPGSRDYNAAFNTGTLQTFVRLVNPVQIETGLINSDAFPDIIIQNSNGPNDSVKVYLSNGAGNYTSVVHLELVDHPTLLAADDINRDDYTDLLAFGYASGTTSYIETYLNNGPGTFSINSFAPVPTSNIVAVDLFDIDGDNDRDIFIASAGATPALDTSKAIIMTNTTPAMGTTFSYAEAFRQNMLPVGTYYSAVDIAAADFTMDGNTDFILHMDNTNGAYFVNNGAGGYNMQPWNFYGGNIERTDLNTDGKPDVLQMNGTIAMMVNDGTGNLSSDVTTYGWVSGYTKTLIADMDLDSRPDFLLCSTNNSGGTFPAGIFFNNGDPTLTINTPGGTTFCEGASPLFTATWNVPYLQNSIHTDFYWFNNTYDDSLAYVANVADDSISLNSSYYGCNRTASVNIVVNPMLVVHGLGQTVPLCLGDSIHLGDYVYATGGTPPITYDWWYGPAHFYTVNPVYYPTGSYNFTITITDGAGCNPNAGPLFVPYNANSPTDLTGHVTTPASLDVDNGIVYAFRHQPGYSNFDTTAYVSLDASGHYNFGALDNGTYLIKVIADQSFFPLSIPTYYGNTFQWDSSIVVNHGCVQTDTADIRIVELAGGSGPGTISGYVVEGIAFGSSRMNSAGGPPHVCIPGGPLKGIDVKLGKNPGSGIQARAMTDSTGYYEFTNLPLQGYKIYVDIPNLPMDSTRAVVLDASNTASVQNNYFADSASVYVDSLFFVGIQVVNHPTGNNFMVYPNPAKDNLFVKYNLHTSGDLLIEISNTLGEAIGAELVKSAAAGLFTHRIDIASLHLKAGVYFISISDRNEKYTQRLVIIE